MTTIVALVLTAVALGIILAPVLRRRDRVAAGASEASLAVWRERYQGSLADLQDAELDWQVGNLSDADYAAVRDEQRRRAAEALREVAMRETILGEVRAEVGLHPRNGVVSARDELSAAPVASEAVELSATAPARRRSTVALPAATPVLLGGAAAAAAVAGVVLLYFSLVGAQAAQRPLATLPIEHAHAVVLESTGLWVGHHGGLLRSSDGQAWHATPASGDVMALVTVGSRRLAFGHDVLIASDDEGSIWTPLAHDLPGTDVHGAQLGTAGIYASVVGFGVFRSADGGHWEPVGRTLTEDVGSLAVLPGSSGGDVLYLNAGGVVARSADGGRTWGGANGAGNLALSGFVNAVAADPNNGLLYAGTSQGLFRSSSGGADWTRLPFRGAVAAIGADGGRVAVVGDRGEFFLSTDGGGTWPGGR